jgi:hypothetical protein
MAKQKLTLALEPDLIAYGKSYAAERGTSVSELLETYLAQLRATPALPDGDGASALVRRIRSELEQGQPQAPQQVDQKAVRLDHLRTKYA